MKCVFSSESIVTWFEQRYIKWRYYVGLYDVVVCDENIKMLVQNRTVFIQMYGFAMYKAICPPGVLFSPIGDC